MNTFFRNMAVLAIFSITVLQPVFVRALGEEIMTEPNDTTPPVISEVAAQSVMQNTATLAWTTNEMSTSKLRYGTTKNYGSNATLDSTAALAHSAILSNLTPNTTYYYCIEATDLAANSATSCDHTFTTTLETPTCTDSDTDGICDSDEEISEETKTMTDTDHDGTPNYLDSDDDGDGIPTSTEAPPQEKTAPDADADSIPDYLEPNTTDTDGDGVTNNLDADDEGDSVPTIYDGTITNDPIEPIDTDSDGTPNYLDPNDDGDALATKEENTPTSTDPTAVDTDGDTVPDYLESNTTDTDHDGVTNVKDADDDGDTVPTFEEVITDTSDTDAAVDEATVDTDNDGIPNALDSDDDGDGIPTLNEDTNHDGSVLDDDTDSDGIPNFEEPNNVDTDQDGLTNNVDSDDDGDSIPTKEETIKILTPPRSSGGGRGYYFVPPLDTDKDEIADYLDTDDDNDGTPTKNEKGDSDQDTLPDYKESNVRDLDQDGKKDVVDNEDDGDGILSPLDSQPYSDACYTPSEIGSAVYIVLPNGTKRMAGEFAKKTVLADNIIRYDFELGIDADFNDLSVRINDEGHRSFIATTMNVENGERLAVHLQILGNGEVEKDITLSTNARSAINKPQRIVVNQYITMCNDHKDFCPSHITQYMKKGSNNDPVEVSKLQSFLVEQEGFTNVQVNGVFDDNTDAGVRQFQIKHSGIILGPWAIQKATGYVYRTTTKQINDLYCAAKK